MKFGIGLRDKQKLNLEGNAKNARGKGALPMTKAGYNTCPVTVGEYGRERRQLQVVTQSSSTRILS